MEGKLQEEFLDSGFTDVLDFLEDKVGRYEIAFEYIEKAIYAQHCTKNHMENTEHEKGQISGLIQASTIVDKAKRQLV